MGLFDLFRKKDKPTASSSEGTRHCFVLCKTSEPGSLADASGIVAEIFGPGYTAEVSDSVVSVTRGEDTIGFLAHLPMPIPENEAAENADSNPLWPDGKVEAAKHRAHVIVTTLGGEEQNAVSSVIVVARLALVALRLYDGLGVYWGNGCISNSREAFESFCEDMSEEHVPLPMLMRFQLIRAPGDKVGLYTMGMKQFDLMEIEVDQSPMDAMALFEFVRNIAHYLIMSGPVIADGNTVGGSAEERILVRHRPSMIEPKRKVYKIVFE